MNLQQVLLLGMLSLCLNLKAQNTCLPDGITFTSQEQVDSFTILYPNCTKILGNLNFQSSSINDLSALSNITEVGLSVQIYSCHGLTAAGLQGLQNLVKIGGRLTIGNNNFLTNLNAFNNLEEIGSQLTITKNNQLTHLSSFNNLKHLDQYFEISENPVLVNIQGFNNPDLDTIGFANILENPDLATIDGFNGVEHITNQSYIKENENLSDITGFQSLSSIHELNIAQNPVLTNMEGYNQLQSIYRFKINDCDAIVDFSDFSNLSTVTSGMLISNNLILDNLDALSNTTFGATILLSGNPNLSSIDFLIGKTKIEGILHISDANLLNSLSALESIQTINQGLTISNLDLIDNLNAFANLDTLYQGLNISNMDNITSLSGFENLDRLTGELHLENNPNLTDLSALNHTNRFSFFNLINNNSLTNLDDFINVENITYDVRIIGNSSLMNLNGFSNVTVGTTSFSSIEITDNPLISICHEDFVCQFLTESDEAIFANNAPGCNSYSEVFMSCANQNPGFGKLQYHFFNDLNENGIHESNEPFFPDGVLSIDSANLVTSSSNNSNGVLLLPSDSYNIQYEQQFSPNWELSTTPAEFQVTFTPTFFCDSVQFGVTPTLIFDEMTSFMVASQVRCGAPFTIEAFVKNTGSTFTSGTLWLTIDDNIDQSLQTADTIVAPNRYGWHFSNLPPTYTFSKSVTLNVPLPDVFPIGNALQLETNADFTGQNGNQTTTTFILDPTVLCAYDPNDKLVSPTHPQNYTLFDKDLIYTIRFQNTGNAPAFDVIIQDTLSPHLDPNTFSVLASSHPNVLTSTMEQNQFLKFQFRDIFLPDSTADFTGSQGYVTYKIRPYENLEEGTIIENTAHIYFDFNPAIVTNTTTNILAFDEDEDGYFSLEDCDDSNDSINPGAVEIPNNGIDEDCDGLDILNAVREIAGQKVEIFPNPVSDVLIIEVENFKNFSFEISDLTGRILKKSQLTKNQQSIDFTLFSSGIYFIKIQSNNNKDFLIEKIVK